MKVKRFRFAPLTLLLAALCLPLFFLTLESFGSTFVDVLDLAFQVTSQSYPDGPVTASVHDQQSAEPEPTPVPDEALVRLAALRERLAMMDLGEMEITTNWNLEALDALLTCLPQSTCKHGQEKVIQLASGHFWGAELGNTNGEAIWAGSTVRALRALNYTLLFSSMASNTLLQYQYIPEMIPIVLWEPNELEQCTNADVLHRKFTAETFIGRLTSDGPMFKDETNGDTGDPSRDCIRTQTYPRGIPIWKSFAFHFWGDSKSPLGAMWTLSPYDRGAWKASDSNQFLGYSIESTCRSVPKQHTKSPNALLLGKLPRYFAEPEMAFPRMLQNITTQVQTPSRFVSEDGTTQNFTFIGTPVLSDGEVFAEPGVHTLAVHGQSEWLELVAQSSALACLDLRVVGSAKPQVGLGWPASSPSPYDALCLGVPFINVVREWDEQDPMNRRLWVTQHDALLPLDPPYVYHVKAKDSNELQNAVQEALNNPIESYIVPEMKFEAVVARHKELVETDWLMWAEEYVDAQGEDSHMKYLI